MGILMKGEANPLLHTAFNSVLKERDRIHLQQGLEPQTQYSMAHGRRSSEITGQQIALQHQGEQGYIHITEEQ